MKYVLDSCVALKWVLAEPDSDKAVQVLDDFCHQIHELLAPDIFPVEVAHALVGGSGILRPPEGALRLQNISQRLPDLHPYLSLLPRAFSIASAAKCGVYDCLYVVLAEREACARLDCG